MSRKMIAVLALVGLSLLVLTACAGVTVQPTTAPPTSAPAQPTVAQAESFKVSIVNKTMTKQELADAIKAEGNVVVGNWTYTGNQQLIEQFQKYVKDTYGVDVKLDYQGSQSPSQYLTALYTALKANNPSPYDVMAIEEPYYFDAKKNNAVETIYPSDLMKNWDRVDPAWRHDPESVAFQSTATPSPIFHADKVGSWFSDWKDLADPRLKGRITMPLSGDITAAGFLIGTAWSLGKDYKDEAQMTEAIDFVCTQIHPNVLKYTTDSAEMQQLLRAGTVDVAGFWNSLARLEFLSGAEGTKDTTFKPMKSGQAPMNGFMWIPKKAPHPILAQIFIDWRLSNDAQSPGEGWGIPKNAWAELYEGPLGPSYVGIEPDWIKPDYTKFYPKLEDVKTFFKPVDWNYYADHSDSWFKQYSKCAGG